MKKINKLALRASNAVSNVFKKDQRGELPSWVNIVGLILLSVAILLLVYSFLPDQLKTIIESYLQKLTNTIV